MLCICPRSLFKTCFGFTTPACFFLLFASRAGFFFCLVFTPGLVFLCKMFWNPKRVLKQAANLSWYCLIHIRSFFFFSFILTFVSLILSFYCFVIRLSLSYFFILFTNFLIFLSFIFKLWLLFIISVNISLGWKKKITYSLLQGKAWLSITTRR